MRVLFAGLMALMMAFPAFAEIGDDGLHKEPWMRDTFKDMREDLGEAQSEGKRLVLFFEQRGCVYCTKMHTEVFPREDVSSYIEDNYFVVQLNLHGDTDVTDFDGEILSEKDMARKWGILFTPTIMFIDETVAEDVPASRATVAVMPGAFAAGTTLDMFTWVVEKRYTLDGDEDFQRYHARRIQERNNGKTD
jgi:thioredoxin-related protein